MLSVCSIAQTVGPTAKLLDGSALPSSEAGWIEAAKRYASGGVVAPSTAPSTAPGISGEIFAKRTDTCGFPIFTATCVGKTVKLFDKEGIEGYKLDIPDGWKLEAAAFNNNPARPNSLLCQFYKVGSLGTKEYRAWDWQVPNLVTQWGAITEADGQATPQPWAKPPK